MTDNILDVSLDFIFSSSVGLLAWFFGGLDGFVKILIVLTVVDYFSGLCVGWVKKELSSATGFNGILKKCLIFSFVGISHVIDKYLLGGTELLRTAVCMFYIGNEGISIIENTDKLGVPFPQVLKEKFLDLKTSDKKSGTKKDKAT